MEKLNQKILNSVGKENCNQYMIITREKEINEILDSHSPVYEMYKYRDRLLDDGDRQDVNMSELEQLLKNNNDIELKQQLEDLFLESLSNSKFKIIKDTLIKHELGWDISKLVEVHKRYKSYRIFRLLNTDYKNWLI